MCLDFMFVIVVLSTSSVVWSQVRQFFLLEYIFCTINHDEQQESLWLSLMFIVYISLSMQYNWIAQ